MITFRFKFNTSDPYKLLKVYKEKWRTLMGYSFSIPRDEKTYDRLRKVHSTTEREFKASDIIYQLTEVNSDGARLMLDCAVLFDAAPYDLRCFILAALGCSDLSEVRGRV